MAFDWSVFANMLTDGDSWSNALKLIVGLGGQKSKEAWQELKNIHGYYSSPLYDGTEYESDNGNTLTDIVGDLPDVSTINDYLTGLLTSVGAENEINREFNSAQSALQREFTASENEKNRQWQTDMRNSAYQSSVADLKAAGLNPILAATNGATSTPTGLVGAGSSASYNVGGGDTFSSVMNGISGIASAISQFLPANKVVQVIKSLGKAAS